MLHGGLFLGSQNKVHEYAMDFLSKKCIRNDGYIEASVSYKHNHRLQNVSRRINNMHFIKAPLNKGLAL